MSDFGASLGVSTFLSSTFFASSFLVESSFFYWTSIFAAGFEDSCFD
jgi:hypothetical protein